jgi:predicted branched-subunit amino acid permease
MVCDTRSALLHGMRRAIPFGIGTVVVAISLGMAAVQIGLAPGATIAMSALVFSGAAQFAAIAVIAQGGTLLAAVVSLTLINTRFVAIGMSIAPFLPGGALRRAVQAQAIAEPSWALSARPDGSFDRWILFGSSSVLYVAFVVGTAAGALGGGAMADPRALGLDSVFPTLFLALLLADLRGPRSFLVAGLAAGIAFAVSSFAPVGIPVLAASFAVVVGIRPDRARKSGRVS